MIRPGRRPVAALILLLAAGAGLYGTVQLLGNRGAGACPISGARIASLAPLARGEVAAFEVATAGTPAPALAFRSPDGGPASLAAFRGRTVLLNLWATWCEPCKREMPALDQLQGELGGPSFEVAAINMDTRDTGKPREWLRQNGIGRLAYYADPEAKIFQELRRAGIVEGLPTTLLVGPDGCILGKLSGWAEWASPDGLALVRKAIGGPA